MIHRAHHVLSMLHFSGFGSGLSQRMDLEDRPCLPQRAEDVLPPQIQRGRNFIQSFLAISCILPLFPIESV